MRAVISIAIVSLIACAIVPRYAAQMLSPPPTVNTVAAARPGPAAAQASGAGSRLVVIPPSRNGHFRVSGRIDGRHVDFMVDTGASVIALKSEDAAMLGIHPVQRDYAGMVRTANGASSIPSRSRTWKCTMSPQWCCRRALPMKICSACRSCGGCGGSNMPMASCCWNNSE